MIGGSILNVNANSRAWTLRSLGNTGVDIVAIGNLALASLDKSLVVDLFKTFGLVRIRGFDNTSESFHLFTESFGDEFSKNRGASNKRAQVANKEDHVLVTAGTTYVPPHGEFYHMGATPPPILFFACREFAATGGETVVYDGFQIYSNLSEEVRSAFERTPVTFSATVQEKDWPWRLGGDDILGIGEFCKEMKLELDVEELPEGKVAHIRATVSAIVTCRMGGLPAFVNHVINSSLIERYIRETPNLSSTPMAMSTVRFSDGRPIPSWWIDHALVETERVAFPVSWQKNDILMVDNTRFMHGRRAFSGPRVIEARFCRRPIAEFGFSR